MTKVSKASFTPVEIPAGLEPRWERRFRGRLRRELDELQHAGITPEPQPDALKVGRLALTFDWPLDGETTLRLKAVYPDAFPHIRPQVFLLSGLDPPPMRHRNPMDGNLCLLGRDSRLWMPSCTLYKLLTEQLEDAIRGTGNEDPQAEPAEFWWNNLGPAGAYCLIDSTWDLEDAQEGTLRLRYVLDGYRTEFSGGSKIRVPIIRAVVTEVRGPNNKVLHRWEGPLPPDVAAMNNILIIPWVRLGGTILPSPELGEQIDELRRTHTRLSRSQHYRLNANLSVNLFAIAQPSELAFGQTGLGWFLILVFGQPNAFKAKAARKMRKTPPQTITTLPVYRAGPEDIGHRVPAVQLLREKRVLVVGIGAVGAPVAIELARNGCGTLHLIEHDIVEPGNTVRWPLGATVWARPKLEALSEFLAREYPATNVHPHTHCLGQAGLIPDDGPGDDDVLTTTIPEVDLVVDGCASHGVTRLLADRCREAAVPLISLFATPNLEGGAVVRHGGDGGCPNCLEFAWHNEEIAPPPGRSSEEGLTQPPGCAERTFLGAGYDLQELSLQAVRLVVETLSSEATGDSLVQTLSFVDAEGQRCPPRWRVDALPKHPACRCRP